MKLSIPALSGPPRSATIAPPNVALSNGAIESGNTAFGDICSCDVCPAKRTFFDDCLSPSRISSRSTRFYRFIETMIVVLGAFTRGTNHFAHSGRPADQARLAEYEAGPYAGFGEQVQQAFAAIMPEDADPPRRRTRSRK